MKHIANRAQRGFTLVEMVITLTIAGGVLLLLLGLSADAASKQLQGVAGSQMARFAYGLNLYVQANSATLSTCATTTVPCPITFAQVQAGNYIPNVAATNVYGQTYVAAVLLDSSGNLLPVAATINGTAQSDKVVQDIAAKITNYGGQGGYIGSAQPTIAQGADGSWGNGITIANWGFAPGKGHLVDAIFVANAAIADDYLHRHATAGQPQLNTMSTAINMNGNALNNVSTLTAPSGGNVINLAGSYIYGDSSNLATRSASGNLFIQAGATGGAAGSIVEVANITGSGTFQAPFITGTSQVASNGNVVAAGNVYGSQGVFTQNLYAGTNGSGAPTGFNSNVYTGGQGGWYNLSYGGGWMMQDTTWIRAYNNKSVYTAGTIWGGALATSNNLSFTGGTVYQGNGCSGSQLAASVDGTGQILECVSGVWTTMGGDTSQLHYVGTTGGAYTGGNPAQHTMWVMVSSQATGCGTNDYGVLITVNGNLVGQNVDDNPDYYKVKTVTVPVPVGGSFTVSPDSTFECRSEQSAIWELY